MKRKIPRPSFPFLKGHGKLHETQKIKQSGYGSYQDRSFTSFQMFHTHAPLPRGFFMEVTNGEELLSVP